MTKYYTAEKMILLDSSFLVAVEVATDQNHEYAIKLMDKIINGEFGDAIISDYIFDETISVTFNKTKALSKAILVGESLNKSCNLLKVSEVIFNKSWETFKKQKNKKLSFTDCTNLALMKEHNIKYIANFDKEFTKVKEIKVVN